MLIHCQKDPLQDQDHYTIGTTYAVTLTFKSLCQCQTNQAQVQYMMPLGVISSSKQCQPVWLAILKPVWKCGPYYIDSFEKS